MKIKFVTPHFWPIHNGHSTSHKFVYKLKVETFETYSISKLVKRLFYIHMQGLMMFER